jgi:hypothetical protein
MGIVCDVHRAIVLVSDGLTKDRYFFAQAKRL